MLFLLAGAESRLMSKELIYTAICGLNNAVSCELLGGVSPRVSVEINNSSGSITTKIQYCSALRI